MDENEEEGTVIVDEIYLITLKSKITSLEEELRGDEKFIDDLVIENSKLTARLNRVRHELQRVIKTNGAEPSWAQELLDKIK